MNKTNKKTALTITAAFLMIVLLTVFFSAVIRKTPASEVTQTVMTSQEYMDHGTESWFLTGKKNYSVQAMMVSKETSFHNDLEVTDYTVDDDGVTVILKGNFDEMWTSKLPKVIATYTKPDGSEISETDFSVKDQYIELVTKAEPDAYYAMYVPLNVSVTVETAWGDELHTNRSNAPHGNGDYLICRKDENGQPDLSDIWVLNGMVFPAYYDTSHMPSNQNSADRTDTVTPELPAAGN